MFTFPTFLSLMHLLGLSLALGASTVKLIILFRCKSDFGYVSVFIRISRHVTKVIITGLILLTLSGIGWLFAGYSFMPVIIVKVVLVGIVWILGPIIDNVIEPKYIKLASESSDAPTISFTGIQNKYLAMEITATGLFYVITILGVLI